jgi:hypothetical protein
LVQGKSCVESAKDLKACCQDHLGNQSLQECINVKSNDACMEMRNSYYHCKRQQMDMRSRIRGHRGFVGSSLDAKQDE